MYGYPSSYLLCNKLHIDDFNVWISIKYYNYSCSLNLNHYHSQDK